MMLLSISIKNIVLVDSMEIPFARGFCVLTGETGAGKSILLDALGISLGKRAEARLLRHGERQGFVTTEFDISDNREVKNILEEHGIDLLDSLLLRRVLYSDGKSKAFVNDSPVSINLLQKISENLIEIHGQHDQRGLLSSSTHGAVLDSYGRLEKELQEIGSSFEFWRESKKEYEELKRKSEKAKEEEDYLKHVHKELEELDPKEGEEEKLAEQRILLMNGEKIIESLNSSRDTLEGNNNISSVIRDASRILERNTKASGLFDPIIEGLDRVTEGLDEVIEKIDEIARDIDMDGSTLERVEERLFTLRAASRKYNRPVEELSEYREEVKEQLGLIENQEEQLNDALELLEESKSKYSELATNLTEKRKNAATKIEKELLTELEPLKMGSARFKVQIESQPEEYWNSTGQDKIGFMVSTNSGSPFGPLGKIASGGELSRFMLALKVVLSGTKSVPTLIFDEIDTGVGGAVADAVGERLEKLAENAQVLSVTHQPQVASHGNYHLRVDKIESADKTTTYVKVLSEKERKEEVARMLAGSEVSDEARAAAVKLMGT